MSDLDRTPAREGCGADAGAYVLGALEHDEAERFRRHLASCAICRDEVATLQVVADALPLAAPPLQPPAALKRRLMSTVRSGAQPGGAPVERRRYAGRRLLAAGSGGLAAVAIAVFALVLSLGGSAGPRVVRATVASPSASAVVRLSGGNGELVVHGLPGAPPGKIYEVWLKRAGAAPAPTDALFGVTSSGAATVAIPGDLHRVERVMVTPEPLGGSRAPTHPAVIVARLS